MPTRRALSRGGLGAVTAVASVAPMAATSADDDAIAAVSAWATVAARPAEAALPGGAGTAMAPSAALPAQAADRCRHTPIPTIAASTPKSGRPARPTSTPIAGGGAGPAVAAIADNPSAVAAGVSSAGRPVSAVAEQRPPRQQLDQVERLKILQRRRVCRLRRATGTHQLHKPGMKLRGLRVQYLKILCKAAEQPGNRARHLISGGRNNPRRGRRGHCGRFPDRFPDPAQIHLAPATASGAAIREVDIFRLPSPHGVTSKEANLANDAAQCTSTEFGCPAMPQFHAGFR